MIKVNCHTNLDDVMRCEEWPDELPYRPVVGDLIRSKVQWKLNNGTIRYLELQVVRTTLYYCTFSKRWALGVEMHLPPSRWANISQFEKWYRWVRDGGVYELK